MNTAKKRINIIDFIAIICILAVAAFFISFYFSDEPVINVSPKETVEVETIVRIYGSDGYPITVGQNVSTNDFDDVFGKIKSIQYAAAPGEEFDDDYTLDVAVIIECSAEVNDEYYKVGNTVFTQGDILECCTRNFCFDAEVTEVRRRIAFADETIIDNVEETL